MNRYTIRLLPVFALTGILLWAFQQPGAVDAQEPSTWVAHHRDARRLAKMLADEYPAAIGAELRAKILRILRDFETADRTRWGNLEPGRPRTPEEIQARRARADELYAEATQRFAAALLQAPGLLQLDGSTPALARRVLQMPFGSGLVLVYRDDAGVEAPAFASTDVDLRWGDQIHVDLPESKSFLLALKLAHGTQGTSTHTLELVSNYQAAAQLSLTIEVPARKAVEIDVAHESGTATEAAVGLYSVNGDFIVPESALDFTGGGYAYDPVNYRELTTTRYWPGEDGFRRCFFVKGRFRVDLPPGSYRLLASKGPEFLPVDRTFRVESEQPSQQTVTLKRWVDMSGRGWHSGDCHIHYARPTPAADERLAFWARAEDLRVGNILRMGDGRQTYFEQYAFGKKGRAWHADGLVVPGQEDPRTNIIGHTISLNIAAPARDLSRYYLYSTAFDEARRQGGLAGYAHVNMNLYRVDRDMTVNVPRGKVDFVEICEFGEIRNTDLYYEFLNLGFRLPAVAGTDIPWAGTLGDSRVYAFTGAKLDADAWFEAVRQGRTFVTVGPVLEFTVNGERPGAVLRPAAGDQLEIHAKVAVGAPSAVALSRLELIVNGEVLRSVEPSAGSAELKMTLPAGQSMWIAVRTAETHSSPIYVEVDGKRHWNVNKAPALLAKRLRTLDEVEQLFARGELGPGHEAEWDAPEVFKRNGREMQAMIAEARSIYRELEQELRAGGAPR